MEQGQLDRRNRTCPYFKKACKKFWENCAFAIETSRTYDNGRHVTVKACAIWFNANEMENHSLRLAMVQKEMGETKNATVFHGLTELTQSPEAREELRRIVMNNYRSLSKFLEGESQKETLQIDAG